MSGFVAPSMSDVRALIPKYCPHYHLVPREYGKNLKWRQELVRAGSESKAVAAELWRMCKEDVLFYTASFIWTFAPKDHPKNPIQPFIPYEYQEELQLDLKLAGWFGEHRGFPKSRDMGLTWNAMIDADHDWRFQESQSILIGSRKEEYVDKKGDEKSLFAKLDFIERYLPSFLQVPERERKLLHLRNPRTNSTIDGESTNDNFGRGDRRTKIVLDEFAFCPNGIAVQQAVFDASNSVRAISTHDHENTAFNLTFVKNPEIVSRRIHWSMHPGKSRGLYIGDKQTGKVKVLDAGYEFPAGYAFVCDNKERSPWYDRECRKRGHRVMVARELDIDPQGSSFRFYDEDMVRGMEVKCREPLHRGGVEAGRWVEKGERGLVRWWVAVGLDRMLGGAPRNVIVGADLSMGTGASNSSVSFGDLDLRMKIGAFVTPHLSPERVADVVHDICDWLRAAGHKVRHKWEANGPGRVYGKRLLELGEGNVYLKRTEGTLRVKESDFPGWCSTSESKYMLLDGLRQGMADGWLLNPDVDAINELRCYIQLEGDRIVHSATVDSIDPTGAGDAHGDRVISDALIVSEMRRPAMLDGGVEKGPTLAEQVDAPPRNASRESMGWRIYEARRREREEEVA
jgi:hypothetical protein